MGRKQTQCRKNNLCRRIYFFLMLFVTVLLVFCDFGFCESHASFGSNWIVPIPHPLTSLLRAEQVRRELDMTTLQIDDVEQVIDSVELPLWRLRDLPHQKRNEQAGLLIGQLKNELLKILTPQQTERLNQLTWQAIGIASVLEPQMASQMNLSNEQVSRISIFLNSSYDEIAALQRNTATYSESSQIAYLRKLRNETEKKVFSVLNNYQQITLRKLMGRPFDLSRVRTIACKAPEFDVHTWINKPKVNLSELTGKVTVVHFYAFGCGNCIRTLPYYNKWRNHFPPSVFQIFGIHRPETQQERDIEMVKKKAVEASIEYPVAIDNESLMWDAWANHIWPSIYLIDKNGYVRFWWYGELNWQGAESEKYLRSKIQELIEES